MTLSKCWKLWEIVNGMRLFFLLSLSFLQWVHTLVFRAQLAQFVIFLAPVHNFKMEVDSGASTPYGGEDWTFGFHLINRLQVHNLDIIATLTRPSQCLCASAGLFGQGYELYHHREPSSRSVNHRYTNRSVNHFSSSETAAWSPTALNENSTPTFH